MSVLGELKRRKVIQVATVYAVVAWLLVQIVTAIEQPLSLPDWVDTFVIVLLAIGFPIALILSWAFDVTPEGISTTEPGDSTPPQSAATFTDVVQRFVLLAVGLLLVDQYRGSRDVCSITPNAVGTTRSSFDFQFNEGNAWYRVITESKDTRPQQIVVVRNWFDELRRLVRTE